jgi:chromosome segregation ATPase
VENRIKAIEGEIPRLEESLGQITLSMSRPEIAADHGKLQEANDKYQQTEQKIHALYEEWEKLSAEIS